MLIIKENTIETWGSEFNLKKLYFYKNFWFWVGLSLLIYILRQSEVLGVELLVNIIVYVYKQVISEPIAFFAFLISIITVHIDRINVLKTDRRAKLSISCKIEGKSKVKASFNNVMWWRKSKCLE